MKTALITSVTAFALLGSACSDSGKSVTKAAEVAAPIVETAAQAPQGSAYAGDAMKMETKVKAVLIYADWCGSCKILDPKVTAAKGAFEGKGMEFVTLDFTAKDDADFFAQAEAAGVEPAIRAAMDGKIKTGQLILVSADGTKVMTTLTKALSTAELAAKFKDALAS